MDIERFCIKFFARPETRVDDALFIDIFHEWIRLKKLSGVLLDVADYRHVPQGPGVMLITHDVNFAMDYADDRFGLFAQRKRGQAGSDRDRILELVWATVACGALLEMEPRLAGALRLEAGAFQYMANDRLAVPNTEAAFAALRPDLEAAAAIIYPGQEVSITRIDNDPRDRLTALVETGAAIDMAALLDRVGAAA